MKKKSSGAIAIGVVSLCLCGGIANACDDNTTPAPSPRPVASVPVTSAPVTSAPVTVAPATTSPTPKATTAKPKPSPTRTTAKPKPKPTTKAPTSVYYANCTEVRAAGAAPLYRGDPGYSRKLDRDGDGVACE